MGVLCCRVHYFLLLVVVVVVVASLKPSPVYDIGIVGAGIGGLCAGALLSKYGKKVVVCESHDVVGGCAHAFRRGKYVLDSGPSLWAGCSVPSTNPLRQVMDAVGCEVEWTTYDGWGMHEVATGRRWRMTTGETDPEIRALLRRIDPIVDAAMACPPMALRLDPLGFAATALVPYLLPAVAMASARFGAFVPEVLTGPASRLGEGVWLDYLSFAISGYPADRTVGAALAYTLGDLYHENAYLDYPVGGSGAVAEALADKIVELGGEVRLGTHVDEIIVEGGRATGFRLGDHSVVRASTVISNADAWTTAALVGKDREWQGRMDATPEAPSFVHLWVGFDGVRIPDDLDVHHSVFNLEYSSALIDAPENMHIISIPSLFDRSLSPPGKHVAHVYAAANEPYDAWVGLSASEYAAKKEKAAEPLWTALEQVVPDVRKRAELVVVGTPLAHARFNRRYRGSYGPAFGHFQDGRTPYPNLFTVGDSNFPGIGVPAAAASAILVANSLVPVRDHARLLDVMRRNGTLCAGKSPHHAIEQ
ncbi:hypothetical protein CTAYLR_010180 [Chrysophaeum taylorii]|uniref:Amine oxidase domain-containing protein n=1 Tax=Chrysophaeum taylorii TaxID=2483200 RepID=A0AAD7ULG7_9STRA|nr:hypothetical protein CTAYLR_010180 [Chrysophaeum taylorii]